MNFEIVKDICLYLKDIEPIRVSSRDRPVIPINPSALNAYLFQKYKRSEVIKTIEHLAYLQIFGVHEYSVDKYTDGFRKTAPYLDLECLEMILANPDTDPKNFMDSKLSKLHELIDDSYKTGKCIEVCMNENMILQGKVKKVLGLDLFEMLLSDMHTITLHFGQLTEVKVIPDIKFEMVPPDISKKMWDKEAGKINDTDTPKHSEN